MLLGAEILVHTDHQNLTQALTKFTTQQLMRWRLLLKEYGKAFHYKRGNRNRLANALSHVTMDNIQPLKEKLDKNQISTTTILNDTHLIETIAQWPWTTADTFLFSPSLS